MSDHTDELQARVESVVEDIVNDHINDTREAPINIVTKSVQFVEGGDDDGATYGTFRVVINDGQFYIDVEASGVFQSFQDCWDPAGESHYTKDVFFDELEDFEYKVIRVVEVGGQNVSTGN